MAKPVSVSDLKTHCLRLVEQVAKTRREIVITKRGKRIARLVPIEEQSADAPLEQLRGTLERGFELSDFDTGVRWRAAED